MTTNFSKRYNTISAEFRGLTSNHESIAKMYDLMHDLQNKERNKEEELILSNVYRLLGFHQSAYEIYKSLVDQNDRKSIKKLTTLEAKAKSHGNEFIIKDIRNYRKKLEQQAFSLDDFMLSSDNKNIVLANKKDIVVFNKRLKAEKFSISLPKNTEFKDYFDEFIAYAHWFSDCKEVLINYYNNAFDVPLKETADKNWFDLLSVLSCQVNLYEDKSWGLYTTCVDIFFSDHLLEMEIFDYQITEMWYDG